MARFSWKAYEELLTKLALKAIVGVMKDHPEESFYAAAFHAFYAEEEGMIGVPLLGANSAEGIEEGYAGWGAPNWYWDEIPFENDKFMELHGALEAEACRADVDHWYKTHSRFMDAMVKVSKALTSKLKTRKQASKDFVVIVSAEESEDYDTLVQRCMSKAKYKKLFVEDEVQLADPRQQCPCCDYVSLPERGTYLICPICFWEDDGQDLDELDESSGSNHGITLREGRTNFLTIGACDEKMLQHVLAIGERSQFEHQLRIAK